MVGFISSQLVSFIFRGAVRPTKIKSFENLTFEISCRREFARLRWGTNLDMTAGEEILLGCMVVASKVGSARKALGNFITYSYM